MNGQPRSRSTIILRFRDLVTEDGGTILEHRKILTITGEVWWGWWARQTESVPRAWLAAVNSEIEEYGPVQAWLFDSGSMLIYDATINEIALSPDRMGIRCPDPSRSPEYYQRGSYPAWFRLSSLGEGSTEVPWGIVSADPVIKVENLGDLASANQTMWMIRYG